VNVHPPDTRCRRLALLVMPILALAVFPAGGALAARAQAGTANSIADSLPGGTLFQPAAQDQLPQTGKSYGAVWADIDGDGRQDFLIGYHGRRTGLYRVDGGLSFSRLDSCLYLPCRGFDQHGLAACDFDVDGFWDLYVSVGADRGRGAGPNQLWQPSPEGRYRDTLPADSPLQDPAGRGRGAVWMLMDGDRYPELVVLNFRTPTRLFRFDGQAWSDSSAVLPRLIRQWTENTGIYRDGVRWFATSVVGDWDNDGYEDILLAGESLMLLRNDRSGSLTDATAASGLEIQGILVAQALSGDLDNDGDLDLLLVYNSLGGLRTWLNESAGDSLRFRPGPILRQLVPDSEPQSAALGDFDNDGLLDLYVVLVDRKGIKVPNLLARGLGDGDFRDVSAEWGGRGAGNSLPCGVWPVDADRDGDLDLMLVGGQGDFPQRRGLCRFYANSAVGKGVTLTLENRDLSPHGMGARVELFSHLGTQTRQVHSVSNYHNSTVLPLHFGLADECGPWRGVVTWRDGSRQEFTLPRSGAAYLVRAGTEEAEELP